MQKCPSCSAPIEELVERCTHCGTLTAHGVDAQKARTAQGEAERVATELRAIAEGARARTNAQVDVDTAGKWAILASVIGMVVCCVFPVGPVLGIVFGLRARSLAHRHGLPGTTLGTAGLILGGLGVALAVTMWIFIAVMEITGSKHKQELQGQLQRVSSAQLDVPTACALTELELIDLRYEGFTAHDDLGCTTTADLEQHGDEALLRDLRFVKGEKKVEVFACLRYRNRWSVQQVRADEDCSAPKPKAKKPEHE